jgi:FAD/FMN-containing dehydrogenase
VPTRGRNVIRWDALRRSIAGEVVLPDSPVYESRRSVFNARFDAVRPAAIVSCASPEDVVEAIRYLGRHDLAHVTRSGGHCFAGHSTTSGVVIDLSPLRSVELDGDVAIIGAGATLGDVYDALQLEGRAVPGGTCPPVGIAGLALGGGLGILGRLYGVLSDRVVGAQIVLAGGRLVECGEDREPELFWALRGAGTGNFGVVTSLAVRTVPAHDVTNVHLRWQFEDAAAVLAAWLDWAPNGPDELAASFKVTSGADPDEPPSVDVFAAVVGSESDAGPLADDLVLKAGADPLLASRALMSFAESRRFWADLGAADAVAHEDVGDRPAPCLFAKSEFFARPLPPDAIGALLANFTAERARGEERELDFMPWGGAYNRVAPDATAFVHRTERFQLKHAAVLDSSAAPAARTAAHRWVHASWGAVHPWGSHRVFPNFADPDLEDSARAYYGTNLDRLLAVKARYDPTNFFHHPQSLPVRRNR